MLKHSRRNFLRATGRLGLALPFLESMPNPALAATGTPPPRVILISIPHGHFHKDYFPQGLQMQTGPENIKYAQLSSISGGISKVFGNRLDGLREKINLIEGLDLVASGGHGRGAYLCCAGNSSETAVPAYGYSFDSVLSQSAAFYPTTPFRKALRFYSRDVGDRNIYYQHSFDTENGKAVGLPYLKSSKSVFTEYFSSAPLATPTPTAPGLDSNYSRRSALNYVLNAYTNLSKSNRLSGADKIQMQQHTEMFRNLAASLNVSQEPPSQISQCTTPASPGTPSDLRALNRQSFDLITAVLNCRRTQIVHYSLFDYSDTGSDVTSDFWHQNAGHEEQLDAYRNVQGWVFDQIAYFLNQLNSIKEENGLTLLDNSVVIVNQEFGYENGHVPVGYPIFMAGSLGGKLKTGYFIDYRQANGKKYDLGYDHLGDNIFGRPYNNFFITLFNALGVPSSQYQRGSVGFGEYNLSASNAWGNPWASFLTDAGKRSSLAFLANG